MMACVGGLAPWTGEVGSVTMLRGGSGGRGSLRRVCVRDNTHHAVLLQGWRPSLRRLDRRRRGSPVVACVSTRPPRDQAQGRRNLVAMGGLGLLAGLLGGGASQMIASAAGAEGTQQQALLRAALLAAIEDGGDVTGAIEALESYSPLRGSAAVAPEALEGTWRLLWASAGAEVSRATRGLSLPVTSLQLIGEGGGVEAGRAANVLDLFGGAVRLRLSSSAVPLPAGGGGSAGNVVLIGPPFRLELVLPGGRRVPIGAEETGDSDTSPILGNETNEFAQVYVENAGRFDGRYAKTAKGDIRCSKVTSGDPTVVGSTFVHVRVA